MENSILASTKKNLGLAKNYTAFDLDIITHINSTLSTLNQLGIGPPDGFMIEDDSAKWSDLRIPMNQANIVKSYIYLKVRMLFDPPATSFHIDAMKKQIEEFEWRLTVFNDTHILLPEEV